MELNKIPKGGGEIFGLSIASEGEKVFISWGDSKEGLFFAELDNGAVINKTLIIDKTLISQMNTMKNKLYIDSSMAVDKEGNVFVLLNNNVKEKGEVILACRSNGYWLEPLKLFDGDDPITIGDIKIDDKGKVHIAYQKGSLRNNQIGCFYMSLMPKSAKGDKVVQP